MTYDCLCDKSKKVEYPCVRHCPLFFDCLIIFEEKSKEEATN